MISVATEIAYGQAWKKLRKKESSGKHQAFAGESARGKPSEWHNYKDLLEKRGELTASDFSNLLGKNYNAVTASLRNYWHDGLLTKSTVEGMILWRLAEEQLTFEQFTSQRLASALSDAGEKA